MSDNPLVTAYSGGKFPPIIEKASQSYENTAKWGPPFFPDETLRRVVYTNTVETTKQCFGVYHHFHTNFIRTRM